MFVDDMIWGAYKGGCSVVDYNIKNEDDILATVDHPGCC